jgi:tetratricopeptide (TPR) repeat protein
MNRLIAFIVTLTLVCAHQVVGKSAAFEDSVARDLISRTLEQTFLMEYEAAFQSVDRLDSLLPDHPIVPLLRVGVFHCQMLDFEDTLSMGDMNRYFDIAWTKVEKIDQMGESAEADLYRGILLGFKALQHQRLDEWWQAVRVGIKSVGYLKSCIAQDSTFEDAYLGVGTYKYWASRATDFINWLPFIPDQKQEGIELMRRTMDQGLFGKEIARSTLAWTMLDYSHPSEAVRLSLDGLKDYPNSRFFLWSLANAYYKMNRFKEARKVYDQLLGSISILPRNNHYNEIGICKQLTLIEKKLNHPEEALKWAERGLSYPMDKEVSQRRKKTIDLLITLKEELSKQINDK